MSWDADEKYSYPKNPIVAAAIAAMRALDACEQTNWADMPESVQCSADATGYMGGDSGHGGHASVSFKTGEGGDNHIMVRVPVDDFDFARRRVIDGIMEVHFDSNVSVEVIIGVGGDWEQGGLVTAIRRAWLSLAPLLEQAISPPRLEASYDALKTLAAASLMARTMNRGDFVEWVDDAVKRVSAQMND